MSGFLGVCSALLRLGRMALPGALALGLGLPIAIAQEGLDVPKENAAGQAAPRTDPNYTPPKEASSEESSWVKVCTKGDQGGAKNVCLVRYEGLEPTTGAILVSAAVRTVEGESKQNLIVSVPTSYSLVMGPGVQIKIDDDKPVQLQYTVCVPTNCQVQLELSKEMLEKMRKGQKMFVAALNTQGKTMAFPIPLTGFSKTSEGPAVDNAAYQAARAEMLNAARRRQIELMGTAAP